MAIQVRRGTQADLIASNLLLGEPAYAIDTKRFLIGSGDSNPLLVVTQESGTWTPVLKNTGGVVQSTTWSTGFKVKTGNVVTIQARIVIGSGTTGVLFIEGLPAAEFPYAIFVMNVLVVKSNGEPKLAASGVLSDSGRIYLHKAPGRLLGEDLESGDVINITGTYII